MNEPAVCIHILELEQFPLINLPKQREYGHADLIPQRHGSHVDRLLEGIEGSMQVVGSLLLCPTRKAAC